MLTRTTQALFGLIRSRRDRIIRPTRHVTLFRGVVASILLTATPALAARSVATHTHEHHATSSARVVSSKSGSAKSRDASSHRHASLHRRGRAYARASGRSDDQQDDTADDQASAAPDPVSDATATAGQVIARGLASWYDLRGNGPRTSSGERFDENALTAAHRTLPLGTRVRVTVVGTNNSVVVTINDRPGTTRRIIDLSKGAARELGILGSGLATVTLSRL